MNTLQRLIKALNTRPLVVHTCSFCEYPCAYTATDNRIFYDSGCDCVRGPSRMRPVHKDEIIDFAQNNKHKIEEFILEAGVS
jgi:hypothetical protein